MRDRQAGLPKNGNFGNEAAADDTENTGVRRRCGEGKLGVGGGDAVLLARCVRSGHRCGATGAGWPTGGEKAAQRVGAELLEQVQCGAEGLSTRRGLPVADLVG